MPQDPLLWIGAALLVAVVVIVAIWAGNNVDFSLSSKGLRFKTSDRGRGSAAADEPKGGARVQVAEEANVAGKVGGIIGVSGAAEGIESVEVAKKAKIRNDVGEIVGVRSEPPGGGGR